MIRKVLWLSHIVIELNRLVDTDRALANVCDGMIQRKGLTSKLVLTPKKFDLQYMEQSVNNVLMLKSYVDSIKPIWQSLTGVSSEELQKIREVGLSV